MTLIHKYSRWDTHSLPNPECYPLSELDYIEKSNGVLVYAVDFCLCHELGHVALEHLEPEKMAVSHFDMKLEEDKADTYAIEQMLRNDLDDNVMATARAGIVMGLSSLLMLSARLTKSRHPDSDDRLRCAMEQLGLSENDDLWGMAAVAIKLWDLHYKRKLLWPSECATFKELFLLLSGELGWVKANEI